MATNSKSLKENLKEGADEVMKAATHTADVTTEKVRHLVSDAASHVADAASHAADAATAMRDSALEQLDDARDALGESGDRLAETLRRAAANPATDSLQARVLSAVAGGVSSAASTLQDRSMSEIAADVRALARRNPAAFAAGAAIAGFVLARFLRASASSRSDGRQS